MFKDFPSNLLESSVSSARRMKVSWRVMLWRGCWIVRCESCFRGEDETFESEERARGRSGEKSDEDLPSSSSLWIFGVRVAQFCHFSFRHVSPLRAEILTSRRRCVSIDSVGSWLSFRQEEASSESIKFKILIKPMATTEGSSLTSSFRGGTSRECEWAMCGNEKSSNGKYVII